MARTENAQEEDPFEGNGYSSFHSLLSHAFPNSQQLQNNNSNSNELETTQRVLQSLGPEKLLESARTIIEPGSGVSKSDTLLNMVSQKQTGNPSAKDKVVIQERRQGLGLKRAQFSMKPDTSKLDADSTSLEKTLDLDKLTDPEEYFFAYQRMENAKKEMERQRGGALVDAAKHKAPQTVRSRRQGILGRSVNYKHLYQKNLSDNQSNISSQVVPIVDSLDTSPVSFQQEASSPHNLLHDMDITGSVDKAERRVGHLLGELLSQDDEDLDKDGGARLLREHLQIKPLIVENISFPDLNVRRNEGKSPSENLAKRRSVLPNIKSMMKTMKSRSPLQRGQEAGSSSHDVSSPTSSGSLLETISSIKKRVLLSSPIKDPSSFRVPQEATRGLVIQENERQFDKDEFSSRMRDSGKFEYHRMGEHSSMVADATSSELALNDLTSSELAPNDLTSAPDAVLDDNSHTLDDSVAATLENNAMNEVPEVSATSSEQHVENDTIPRAEQQNETNPIPEIDPEQASEEVPAESQQKQRKTNVNPRKRKSRAFSRRHSLAAAGTSWNDGIRRSTRIRTRPLEFWRGERLLYGRVHRSIPTVIGMKYMSSEDGKSDLKVKSYVPDNYKDLVQKVASH